MSKPTDAEILATLKGDQIMTYVVANKLRRKYHPLKTDFVLRRLKALEAAGKVRRVPTVYAVQICWALSSDTTTASQAATDAEKGPNHG